MEQEIGKITHYFNKIGVAIIELSTKLKVGDKVHIVGNTSDWVQDISSMQIEHDDIKEAKKGDQVGIKSKDHARVGDSVYVVTG